jgi:ECF transporter S component (folate family)
MVWLSTATAKREVKTVRSEAQRISYLAVMTALGVILTRVASFRLPIGGVEGIRIGLGALPLIMSGVIWGPTAGFFVGAVSDAVGYFINPMGFYMPHFTLTSALTGALPALVLKLSGNAKRPQGVRLAVAILIGQTITSMILVPYFLQQLFGIPWCPLFVPRLISLLIHVPAYTFLIHSLTKRTDLLARLANQRPG